MFEMDDMPYKPGKSPAEIEEGARREWQAELKKREIAAKRKATRDANAKRRPPTARQTTVKRTQTARAGNRPVKKLPPMRTPGGQPRDSRGRWVKVGAALWSGTKATVKGTVKAVKGTAKAVGKAHKTVKRVSANARRRANLEARERRIALAEREKKLGLRKKKVTRRRRK
jgi:hypothetical protein